VKERNKKGPPQNKKTNKKGPQQHKHKIPITYAILGESSLGLVTLPEFAVSSVSGKTVESAVSRGPLSSRR
jgi:hypothetical protein